MADQTLAQWNLSKFRLPYQAMQDTTWFTINIDVTQTDPTTGTKYRDVITAAK